MPEGENRSASRDTRLVNSVERPGEATIDPRVTRSRQIIRAAALAELADAGYGGFTIESVAARAGVGKSTIYRHWDGKLSLIEDALEVLNVQPAPDVGAADSGSVRRQIEQILVHLAEALADSTMSSCIPALVEAAEHEPAVRKFLHEYSARRRATLTELVRRGISTDEVAEDVDPELASRALAGAIFYSRLVAGEPFDPDSVPMLVHSVLRPSNVAQSGSRNAR
jgi:AcrR family transcriptional regulator